MSNYDCSTSDSDAELGLDETSPTTSAEESNSNFITIKVRIELPSGIRKEDIKAVEFEAN